MNLQAMENQQILDYQDSNPNLHQKEQIRQELHFRIQELLEIAKTLPANTCIEEIRRRLISIQQYCQTVGKTFIFVEQEITCAQYDLNGSQQDNATLFRGPKEDASVAICLTQQGSLLYRNGCPWIIYRNAADIKPYSNAQFKLQHSPD